MTKKQKSWLAVFLAMFLIPEILWSAYSSFYCAILFFGSGNSFQLFNLVPNPKSLIIQRLILLIQFFGLLPALVILTKSQVKNKTIKLIAVSFLAVLLILAIYSLYFMFSFNPQIG
ncbi:MAG: hypothetical protein WBC48_00640 [Minisyncoccales bacterium]